MPAPPTPSRGGDTSSAPTRSACSHRTDPRSGTPVNRSPVADGSDGSSWQQMAGPGPKTHTPARGPDADFRDLWSDGFLIAMRADNAKSKEQPSQGGLAAASPCWAVSSVNCRIRTRPHNGEVLSAVNLEKRRGL